MNSNDLAVWHWYKFDKLNVSHPIGFHKLPDVMTRVFTHDTFGKRTGFTIAIKLRK